MPTRPCSTGWAPRSTGTTPVDDWGSVEWWAPLEVSGGDVQLPEELAGYQTYLHPGLPPTPIAAPRASSVAAIATANLDGYLFFVAGCPGGTRDGSHYFARTLPEHNANIAKANGECSAGDLRRHGSTSAGCRILTAAPPSVHAQEPRLISTGDVKKGVIIELDGQLMKVLDWTHIEMARARHRSA